MEKFNLLDVVALLHDLPGSKITKGQVGTIVEKLDDHVFEVEFCNNKGETLAIETLHAKDLFLLNFELSAK
jgi:Domain of unknown function (DUF4926)